MKFNGVFLIASIFIGLVGAGTQDYSESTEASFNDRETSSENIISAGTLDINETLSKFQQTLNSKNESEIENNSTQNDSNQNENGSKNSIDSDMSLFDTSKDNQEVEREQSELGNKDEIKQNKSDRNIVDNEIPNEQNYSQKTVKKALSKANSLILSKNIVETKDNTSDPEELNEKMRNFFTGLNTSNKTSHFTNFSNISNNGNRDKEISKASNKCENNSVMKENNGSGKTKNPKD